MSNKQFRTIVRWIHIIGAALIGTYIYSPWSAMPEFTLLVQFGVIPILGLTGIALWQQPRLLKWLNPRRNQPTTN